MIGREQLLWPAERAGQALRLAAERGRLSPRTGEVPPPPLGAEVDALAAWTAAAAEWLGCEAVEVSVRYGSAAESLRTAAPGLLIVKGAVGSGRPAGVLVVLASSPRHATLLAPDLVELRVPVADLRRVLAGARLEAAEARVHAVLAHAGLDPRRAARATGLLVDEQLDTAPLGTLWHLRAPISSSFRHQLVRAGATPLGVAFLIAYGLAAIATAGSWWPLGKGALSGRLDPGWLWAWALLLGAGVVARLGANQLSGRLIILIGGCLRQRLLATALELPVDQVRRQGIGGLIGRVIESEAVEALATSGGLLAVTSLIDLAVAAVVLGLGAAPGWHLPILLGLLLLSAHRVGGRLLRARHTWTETRVSLTEDMLAQMVGHRTRLAQLPPEAWHADEDQALPRYLHATRTLDREEVGAALLPRVYLLLSLAALVPAYAVSSLSPAALAVSLGGVLLAYRGLRQLASASVSLVGAMVSWRAVRPLLDVPAQAEAGAPGLSQLGDASDEGGPLLETERLSFHHPGRKEPALRDCTLSIRRGERILVEGPSGAGKSTLASLVTGLNAADAGLLLLRGLDRRSFGARAWRRRVAAAPQFHENHVLLGSFAFNLLFGRRWPPRAEDLADAEALCEQLGLGPLLARMPGGLGQTVGDSGWQLSHGERSRLFIARALLQGGDLLVLDESFAALDPETLQRALTCVLEHAPTLLVIAHP